MAELKWLEDLVALMEEASFTKAAERRFVTQPAFSRRIRLLEDWLGVQLVERKRKPVSILPLVHEHETEIRNLVSHFYQLRNNLQNSSRQDCAVFVVQHTLAVSHFPALIKRIQSGSAYQSYRLHTANNEDCCELFTRKAQYMLCYEVPGQRLLPAQENMKRDVLESDQLIPVIEPGLYADLFTADSPTSPANKSLPVLTYPKGGFLADTLLNSCLPAAMRHYQLEVICESAFAISLKEMVLAGLGIAWLPRGLIRQELANDQLIALHHILGQCELLVCLYQFEP
jgi:DNA-binding transcriptional LysR family regulator